MREIRKRLALVMLLGSKSSYLRRPSLITWVFGCQISSFTLLNKLGPFMLSGGNKLTRGQKGEISLVLVFSRFPLPPPLSLAFMFTETIKLAVV
ncbi:hypothetical protein TcWFU_000920 [Taenia crassiceps]|uniref:Uncharacterized protein n=1 Tax=Taenia crassiceps TaxID=6207 RepID=A0ABR4QG49_9CEST